MKHKFVAALGLTAAILAWAGAPARADDPDSSFVRQHAIDLLEDALAPSQITTLQLVAHQAAIATACEGFELDDAKFQKVFATLAPLDPSKMSAEAKAYYDQHLLVIYGVLLGGELAAMSDDLSDACAMAADTRADKDMADQLVWQ